MTKHGLPDLPARGRSHPSDGSVLVFLALAVVKPFVVRALNPDRSLASNPLFQVVFVHQKTPLSSDDSASLAAFALGPRDRMCILHRDLGAHFVRGVTPDRYLANYMGRSGGVTGGKDGNMHFGDRELGCVGMVSMLPDMMLVATGMAMAFKLRHEKRCAITWFGDGSTSRGDFHEAMNWAGVQKLPVIFVLENNQYAYSTPVDQQFAVNPVERVRRT